MTTAGLVLAAGEGRRFGSPKAAYVLDGERLVDRAVRILTQAGCSPVFVVLGAWVADVPQAEVIINDEWSEGMGSSLRVGLTHLEDHPNIDRILVTLVDLPGLSVAAVQRMLGSAAKIAVAEYDGRRGHPVLLHRSHWSAVREAAIGDRGARDYLDKHAEVISRIEVGDVATGEDLDTPPL